jgi:UDP-N-acetylmuramate: L-alanyl-gamma-D-glutamyl-meso-diaminopimelate ligase
LGRGGWCILEGDEYDTACFDKHPKAFHYAPFGLVLTHVEFDHADIYRDLGHIREAFRYLIGLIPPYGFLLAFSGVPGLKDLWGGLQGRRLTYGELPSDSFSLGRLKFSEDGMTFSVLLNPSGEEYLIETPLKGVFTAQNLTAAFGASLLAGVHPKVALEGLKSFSGVQRRLETIYDSKRFCLIEDFAHHPTAVRAVLMTLRVSYPSRELRVVFEPRSNTMRRRVLQEQLIEALALADRVFLRPLDRLETIPEGQNLDIVQLQRQLQELGTEASIEPDLESLVRRGIENREKPVVLALLSNGDIHSLKEGFLGALLKEES